MEAAQGMVVENGCDLREFTYDRGLNNVNFKKDKKFLCSCCLNSVTYSTVEYPDSGKYVHIAYCSQCGSSENAIFYQVSSDKNLEAIRRSVGNHLSKCFPTDNAS